MTEMAIQQLPPDAGADAIDGELVQVTPEGLEAGVETYCFTFG